jgi:ABC-type uncharacterized transport system involved in gliding motility auxiliary subunit
MMRDLATIFRRELGAYFNSAIAYIFLIVFALVTCGIFMLSFFLAGRAEMRSFFSMLPIMLVVFIPAITMRLWAEDRKGGTFELLLTLPMSTLSLVAGKFMASFIFYLLGLATTLVIPITLACLGSPDWGPILGGYFGSILCGAFYISIGLFISGLCKDQIVAFVVTMVTCFAFYMLGMPFVAAVVDGWTGGLNLGTHLLSFVAMTSHFESVERGLIDLGDIVYFVAMTALFIGLNALYLDSRLRRHAKSRFFSNVSIYVALVIFVNIVASGFNWGRFDLTQEKIYTVSKEASTVLARLKVPVRINYYVSAKDKMPSMMKNFEQEVVDKLSEFEIASGGNLKFSVHHVEAIDALSMQQRQMRDQVEKQLGADAANQLVGEKDESEKTESEVIAEKLMDKGIQPFPVQSIGADEQTTVSIYSAISIAYKEKNEEVIPQIVPQNFAALEYELISKVFRLTRDSKPKVAIIAPKDEMDPQMRRMMQMQGMQVPPAEDNFKFMEQILRHEDYEAQRIEFVAKQSIPDDMNTVVAVYPRQWDERQRWEINRALRSGKSVVLAVQSYAQNFQRGSRSLVASSQSVGHGMNELLEQYGVKVSEDFLLDRRHETLSIQAGESMGPFRRSTPIKLPMQILLTERSANKDVSISSQLSTLFYLWGTALDLDENKLKDNGLKSTVLLSSGDKSWTAPFHAGELTTADIKEPATFDGGKPLAVMIEGQFPDIFEGKERPAWPKPPTQPGQPPQPDESENEPAPAPLEAKPGKLILVGCAEIWKDNFMRNEEHGKFFINSVDALTLGDELINVRSKAKVTRLIEKVSAGTRLWYRFLVMGLAPLALALLGIGRLWMRRRRKEAYLREVARA